MAAEAELADLKRPPSRRELAAMCAALPSGGHVVAVRRLPGGIECGMHAVELADPPGPSTWLVVRCYGPRPDAADVCLREWRTLGLLSQAGIQAPRPVWLDAEGEVFGCPAMATSLLPGRPRLAPRDPVAWGRQLARALAAIHLTPLTGTDVGFLPCQEARLDALLASGSSGTRVAEHPDGELVWAALRRWRPRLPGASPALVHGDYWVGNTLWEGRRLTGVVDWSDAYLGDPAADVGYCRTGLASVGGPAAPRAFLDEYEAVTGGRVRHLFFWDLLGAWRALPDPGDWVAGLHDLGRRDITRDQMRAELREFIAEAMALAV